MKKLFISLFAIFMITGCSDQTASPTASTDPVDQPDLSSPLVTIETSKGTMKLELYPEDAPKTVANFLSLVESGFYDGLTFHRVVPGFVIQGGDPAGNGSGGSDTQIPLEIKCEDDKILYSQITDCPVKLPHRDGALAMARSASPDSASSQFYITLGEQAFLDGKYAVFGQLIEGSEVATSIAIGDQIISVKLLEKK